MIEAKGGCHCRAVRFTAQLPDPPVPALDCNCSVCRATGFIHIMVPHGEFVLDCDEIPASDGANQRDEL